MADQKINLVIEIDGKQPFGERSTWDDLADITLYSEIITARQVNSSYVLNLNTLYFKESISVMIYFSTTASVSAVYGAYDLCEAV